MIVDKTNYLNIVYFFHSNIETFFESTALAKPSSDQVNVTIAVERTFEILLENDTTKKSNVSNQTPHQTMSRVGVYLGSQRIATEERFARFACYCVEIETCKRMMS